MRDQMLIKRLLFVLCVMSLSGCGSVGADMLSLNLASPLSSSTSSPSFTEHRPLAVAQSESASKNEDEASLTPKLPAKKRDEKPRAGTTMGTSVPAAASAKSATTPNVGSPEWEKEKRENDRQEQHVKEVIDGICRGC